MKAQDPVIGSLKSIVTPTAAATRSSKRLELLEVVLPAHVVPVSNDHAGYKAPGGVIPC